MLFLDSHHNYAHYLTDDAYLWFFAHVKTDFPASHHDTTTTVIALQAHMDSMMTPVLRNKGHVLIRLLLNLKERFPQTHTVMLSILLQTLRFRHEQQRLLKRFLLLFPRLWHDPRYLQIVCACRTRDTTHTAFLLTFAMGTHPRLGAHALHGALDPDVMLHILQMADQLFLKEQGTYMERALQDIVHGETALMGG